MKRLLACIVCAFFLMSLSNCSSPIPEDSGLSVNMRSLVVSHQEVLYDSVVSRFYDKTKRGLESIRISSPFVSGFAPTQLKVKGKTFNFLAPDGDSCFLRVSLRDMHLLGESDSTIVFEVLDEDNEHITYDTVSFRITSYVPPVPTEVYTCIFFPDTVRRSYDLDCFVEADSVTAIDSLEVTITVTGDRPELHWADGRVFDSWTHVSDSTWRMCLSLEELFPNGRTATLEPTIHFETPQEERIPGTYSFLYRRLYVGKGDPLFSQSWHLDFVDTVLGYPIYPNAHINILDAWEQTKGAGVTVAVIDNSYDRFHEDLTGVTIYNVVDGSAVADHVGSHGTACAGVIGARENGVGVIGVAPESDLLLIGVPSYTDASLVKAFAYAVEQRVKVLSCSWGTYNTSPTLESAIEKAYKAGISIVFAAGNEGKDLNLSKFCDESELSTVIGVSASDEWACLAGYSNYGDSIDIMAPGRIKVLDNIAETGYSWVYGTSLSAPVVAGVIALMYAVDPSLTPDEVRQILIETAAKVPGNTNEQYDAKGFNKKHAYGRVDAAAAVARVQEGLGVSAIQGAY